MPHSTAIDIKSVTFRLFKSISILSGEVVQRRALKQAANLSKISDGLYDELRKEICMITCSRIELRNGSLRKLSRFG